MKGNFTPDSCAGCHRAHTAQAPYLLKEDQEALCFTCHGSSGTGSSLDVADGVGYSEHTRDSGKKAGALRGGGFEYALIDTNSVTPVYDPVKGRLESATIPPLGFGEAEATTSTHSVGVAGQTMWGNGALGTAGAGKTGITLECASCHDPHGNGNYRILKGKPDDSGAAAEVNIDDASTKVYTTSNYWQAWDTNDRQYRWKVSEWCSTCHTRYLANKDAPMTSSGDAVFSYRHHTEYTQAEYETLEASSSTKTKPNCVQCHVSHGSNASMGTNSQSVAWPGGSTERGPDSSLLRLDNRGVCQTCHHK